MHWENIVMAMSPILNIKNINNFFLLYIFSQTVVMLYIFLISISI